MKNVIHTKYRFTGTTVMSRGKDALKRSEITVKDRQDENQHSARMIITLSENPFCPQESYWIIIYFFHVIP